MRCHDDRSAELAVYTGEHEDELPLRIGVELRGGLVEQQQPRPQRKHGSQVHKLLLATRQRLGGSAHNGLDPKEVCDLGNAAAHLVLPHAEVLEAKGKLMPHGVAHDLSGGILHNEPDLLRRLTRRKAGNRNTVLENRASEHAHAPALLACRGKLGLERAQQRGLAAASGTHKHAERTLFNRERNVAERPSARLLGIVCGNSPGIGAGSLHAKARRLPLARVGKREVLYLDDRHCHASFACSTTGTAISAAYGR